MGRIPDTPTSALKEKIDWFMNSPQCRELDRIDGELMEFEWKIFPGFISSQILAEIPTSAWHLAKVRNKKGGRVVSKSRPVMNVSSYLVAKSSSAASSPIASKKPGDVWSFGETRYQDES